MKNQVKLFEEGLEKSPAGRIIVDNLMMILLRHDYEKNIGGISKLLKINQETLRANSDIDWNDSCFDDKLV